MVCYYSIQVLSLHSNQLSDLCQLKYLTACTSLVDLDLSDNPVTDVAVRIGFDLRPLMLFLLPRLQR
jgi:Leucine-rich repeat (LRR) protein